MDHLLCSSDITGFQLREVSLFAIRLSISRRNGEEQIGQDGSDAVLIP